MVNGKIKNREKEKIDGSFITIGSVLSVFMLFTLKAGFTQLYTFRF